MHQSYTVRSPRHTKSGVGCCACPLGRLAATAAATITVAALALATPTTATAGGGRDVDRGHGHGHGHGDKEVRFATFNASLNRNAAGQLVTDLSTPDNAQAQTVAEIIQRSRPDVLLVNEFDYDADGEAAELFRDNYLEVSQNGARPADYPYYFVAPSPTPASPAASTSNNNGTVGGGDDAFGFGAFPGPVRHGRLLEVPHRPPTTSGPSSTSCGRTCPARCCPDDPATPAPADWYSPAELAVFRLSSKSHWDVPIAIGNKTVHFLVAHPTPPVFDGPEDRNGTRNFDEIRFWADYVGPSRSSYIYDDDGPVRRPAPRGEVRHRRRPELRPARRRLDPRRRSSSCSTTRGSTPSGPRQRRAPSRPSALQGGNNATHAEPAAVRHRRLRRHRTRATCAPTTCCRAGDLKIEDSAVFWPVQADPLFRLTGVFPFPSSDHRLVWVDLKLQR